MYTGPAREGKGQFKLKVAPKIQIILQNATKVHFYYECLSLTVKEKIVKKLAR